MKKKAEMLPKKNQLGLKTTVPLKPTQKLIVVIPLPYSLPLLRDNRLPFQAFINGWRVAPVSSTN